MATRLQEYNSRHSGYEEEEDSEEQSIERT